MYEYYGSSLHRRKCQLFIRRHTHTHIYIYIYIYIYTCEHLDHHNREENIYLYLSIYMYVYRTCGQAGDISLTRWWFIEFVIYHLLIKTMS